MVFFYNCSVVRSNFFVAFYSSKLEYLFTAFIIYFIMFLEIFQKNRKMFITHVNLYSKLGKSVNDLFLKRKINRSENKKKTDKVI